MDEGLNSAGFAIIMLALLLIWLRMQTLAVSEFVDAAKDLRSDPLTTLPRLIEIGKKISERRFEIVVQDTRFFRLLNPHLKSFVSNEEGRVMLAELFRCLGSKLIKANAEETVRIPVAIFHFKSRRME